MGDTANGSWDSNGLGGYMRRQETRLSRFDEYIERKMREYGSKFDPSDLDRRFIPYFNSQERIKVDFVGLDSDSKDVWGHSIMTGTVSVTTGWKPSFMLMRTSRSQGSSWLLGPRDIIREVKVGREYRPAIG